MRLVLVVLLTVAVAFSGFSQQQEGWYQGKPIRDIVFTGLRHIKASELEGLMEPYRGRLFDDEIFWEIQGQLYALEYFDLISPTAVPADAGSGVIIRFAVTERPIVSRINFVGNSHLRRNELLDTVSIKVNDVVNQMKIRVDEQAIVNKYLEKGYPDIRVRSDTQTGADSSMILTFYITEGEKITIQEFRFEGNSIFSTRALRGQLSLKAKGLLNDGAFQEAKLQADRAALTQYYHDRGYIDADIIDVVRDVQKDEKGNNNLIITFRIREGRLYTFGGIEPYFLNQEGEAIENSIFSKEQLLALVTSKIGETANARRVEADLQRMADLYFENGYIFNTIGREENRDAANGIISYRIPIVERGRAHIENIIIRGNEKTRTEVILREIPLEPGDVFSKAKIMDVMRNLYNLQYFSNVIPDSPPGSADGLMDLVVTVEEQPTTDVQFGMTFSGSADPDTFPVSLLLKWNDRNFRGTGNMLGAEVNASKDTFSGSLEYTQRWLFGLPLSGGFDATVQWANRSAAMNNTAPFFNGDETYAFPDGFISYKEYEDANRLPPNEYLMKYNQWYMSLGFTTGYRLSTFLGNLSLNGGIRGGLIRNDYDASIYRPFDPTLRERNNEWTPKDSFWISLALDQRDIYFDPSRGYYGIERVGFYGILPNEREHYIRSDTKAEYFHTLLNLPITDNWNFKMIFGIHTGVSLIFKQPGRPGDTVPIEDTNKLSVDGMFVGRGWTSEYRNRGLALWENWVELRLPIVAGIFAWDFFFDAAGVKENPEKFFTAFRLEDMRFSFGAGLRFTIPQFPFRFSLAKRFRVVDGQFHWERGIIWANENPASGIDPVISFALSY
jgi:outer membrane protein insertion porin family